MKKIKIALLTLLSLSTMALYASDFEYFITGIYGNGQRYSNSGDLPSDFLDKEQNIEKEFEITDGPIEINGKYKVQFYNSTEYTPKRKIVVILLKLNPKSGEFENISDNFYFFEDTKFWFAERAYLSPNNYFALSVSTKNYFGDK